MNLVYSLFFYLSYVSPAYEDVTFHPSIGAAPGIDIYDAREAIARTAQINSVDEEWDDNIYHIDVATDLFETRENQETGLGKLL